MKSFNVKSNAKRVARGIAAKYPGVFEAAEPLPVEHGAWEWFPALHIIGSAMPDISDDVRETCVITNAHTVTHGVQFDPATAESAVSLTTPGAIMFPDAVDPATFPADPVVYVTPAEFAKAAAALPPPVQSSRAEIEARRAERRARIDSEKAAGTFGAKPEKISKKKILLDLMRREDGATQAELEAATGWQPHTLRGFIAGTIRKQLAPIGKTVECQRGRGDVPTRYFVADLAAASGKGGA